MVFSVTFNNISLYCGGQFYWWRKGNAYQEKTTDLLQVTDKLYHVKSFNFDTKKFGCRWLWLSLLNAIDNNVSFALWLRTIRKNNRPSSSHCHTCIDRNTNNVQYKKSNIIPPWYNWNIVESGAKYHNSNPNIINFLFYCSNLPSIDTFSGCVLCLCNSSCGSHPLPGRKHTNS